MKAQKIANQKSKIKNSSTRLSNLARAHEDAEVAFEFAQAPREFERAAGRERRAGDCVLALAHERLKFSSVAAGARGDACGEHVECRARRDPAVARERAARASVDVFDGEVVGARALLKFCHRGNVFEL